MKLPERAPLPTGECTPGMPDLQRVFIVVSKTAAAVAVVAPPIRKLAPGP